MNDNVRSASAVLSQRFYNSLTAGPFCSIDSFVQKVSEMHIRKQKICFCSEASYSDSTIQYLVSFAGSFSSRSRNGRLWVLMSGDVSWLVSGLSRVWQDLHSEHSCEWAQPGVTWSTQWTLLWMGSAGCDMIYTVNTPVSGLSRVWHDLHSEHSCQWAQPGVTRSTQWTLLSVGSAGCDKIYTVNTPVSGLSRL